MKGMEQSAAAARMPNYEVLGAIAQAVRMEPDLASIFCAVTAQLRAQMGISFSALLLQEPGTERLKLYVFDAPSLFQRVQGEEEICDQGPAGWLLERREPTRYGFAEVKTRFPKLAPLMETYKLRSFWLVGLATAHGPMGALLLGAAETDPFAAEKTRFLEYVGAQLAVALECHQNSNRAREFQQRLATESDHLRTLLEVMEAIVSPGGVQPMLEAVSADIRRVMGAAYTALMLEDPATRDLLLLAEDNDNRKAEQRVRSVRPSEATPAAVAFRTGQAVAIAAAEMRQLAAGHDGIRQLLEAGGRAVCSVPLKLHDRLLGTLNVTLTQREAFVADDVRLLGAIAGQVAIAVDHGRACREIAELKEKLARQTEMEPGAAAEAGEGEGDRSLELNEREYIRRVLREANGIVGGPRGAAARMGLKRTTLLSRMKRLGIEIQEQNPHPHAPKSGA